MERFLVVLVLLSVFQFCTTVDAGIQYVYTACANDFNYTEGSVYETNLNLLLDKLTLKSSSLKFYGTTVGDGSNQVYGLFQCRDDLSLLVCNMCVKVAAQNIIPNCPFIVEVVTWYFECTLWYADHNISSVSKTEPGYIGSNYFSVTNYDEFAPVFDIAMNGVIKTASTNMPHFASSETSFSLYDKVYCFAQCTPDIDGPSCKSCLEKALSTMVEYSGESNNGLTFYPSCQIRYDTSPFMNEEPAAAPPPSLPPPANNHGSETSKGNTMKTPIIGAIVSCTVVGLIVLAVVLCICLRRKKQKESIYLGQEPRATTSWLPEGTERSDEQSIGDTDFFLYNFATLQFSTRNFSDDNKLGEGGFGSVYKGTLETRELLAIKRLSGTGGQGTKEFMTEARLLAKLQHKNLVRLLGFCSEGDEKLLVYEFMPNGSLDGYLFDATKRPLLNWIMRHSIITGIARGLQYLHEDSRLTIVHRDLKPANILLDKEMNPKIADFGLAKLFEGAEKFGNTNRIVGTQGYMAPEYLMTGDYSDKSDVYSFGIMLLEIVSGQKNRVFKPAQKQDDLSIQTWRLWTEDRSLEITDPEIINNCSSNDVMRCIQIGLLCLQANPDERPTMTAVVLMLTVPSVDIPQPLPPGMSSNNYGMAMNYSGAHQSGQSSTKSVTRTDMGQDVFPTPR